MEAQWLRLKIAECKVQGSESPLSQVVSTSSLNKVHTQAKTLGLFARVYRVFL